MSRDAKEKLKETRQLSLIQNITDLLLTTFSTHFVFPALGHDDLHSKKELSQIWNRWLPAESMTTFETGSKQVSLKHRKQKSYPFFSFTGGYYLIERKDQVLQIVVLNTILWTSDYYASKAEAQFKWLESVLNNMDSPRKFVKVIEMM